MVFICIRCNYETDHILYMENHLKKKNKCKLTYFLLLSNEDQLKLSSLSIYHNKEHIKFYLEYLNNCLKIGIENIIDFSKYYQLNITEKYNQLENERLLNKIKKKYHLCFECGFYFDNKSNLLRHQKLTRCFMNKFNINTNLNNVGIINDCVNTNNDYLFLYNLLDKGYIEYIKYKIKNEKIDNHLYFIENIEDNHLIILNENIFKRVNRSIYFEKWLKNTMDEFEKIFEEMSHSIDWKTLKTKYNLLLNEYNSLFLNIECLKEWSFIIYNFNNNKFIDYVKLNKNSISNFIIINE